MADWTERPIEDWEKLPGAVDPPAPDAVQPTDAGWSDFVRRQTDLTGLKWTHDCAVSIEVTQTGRHRQRAVHGDNPDDYSADKDWGWKEDRNYETSPPEPYQDFTRWVRHYPKITTQRFIEYRVQVFVRCGAHFVARGPSFFWKADGAPVEQTLDVFAWTKTSGMQTDASGKQYKWRTTGKKLPPHWQWGEPQERDLSRDQSTPPETILHPYEPYYIPIYPKKTGLGPDYPFGYYPYGVYPLPFSPLDKSYSREVEPGQKSLKWSRAGDVFGGD